MRGQLFIAGVRDNTPVGAVLDVLTVAVMAAPGEALKKWRTGLDRAVAAAAYRATRTQPVAQQRLDRATWGLQPGQVEQQRAFLNGMGAR